MTDTPVPKGHWQRVNDATRTRRGTGTSRCWHSRPLLDNHEERGVISILALASALGVDPKTVRMWLSGANRPDEETQDRVSAWIKLRRAEINRRKGIR